MFGNCFERGGDVYFQVLLVRGREGVYVYVLSLTGRRGGGYFQVLSLRVGDFYVQVLLVRRREGVYVQVLSLTGGRGGGVFLFSGLVIESGGCLSSGFIDRGWCLFSGFVIERGECLFSCFVGEREGGRVFMFLCCH